MNIQSWVLIASDLEWEAYSDAVEARHKTRPVRPSYGVPFYVRTERSFSIGTSDGTFTGAHLVTMAFGPTEASRLLSIAPVRALNDTPRATLRNEPGLPHALEYIIERLKHHCMSMFLGFTAGHNGYSSPEDMFLSLFAEALDRAGIAVNIAPTGMPLPVPESPRPEYLPAPSETPPDGPGRTNPDRGDLVDL
jgi:hypothetical protein